MIYEVDTDQLAEYIKERLNMGFTAKDSILFTVLTYPPTQKAIFDALQKSPPQTPPLKEEKRIEKE